MLCAANAPPPTHSQNPPPPPHIKNPTPQSFLAALAEEVSAKADIRGNLSTYKYYDNVWQFLLKDVSFRLNPTGQGSARKAPEVRASAIKLVCVEYKLATAHMQNAG